jgi:hypothetical protein
MLKQALFNAAVIGGASWLAVMLAFPEPYGSLINAKCCTKRTLG